MDFRSTGLPGVTLITPRVIADSRGWFAETWQARKFAAGGIGVSFVQDNESFSGRGVLRGLHYQLRHPQGKLVRALRGSIFDVAVDMRRSSPTFGRWTGELLSDENQRLLYVPPGFAHGFLVLSEHAHVGYKVTDFYAPEHERTLAWNDPSIGIAWPTLEISPILDARDAAARGLDRAECFA